MLSGKKAKRHDSINCRGHCSSESDSPWRTRWKSTTASCIAEIAEARGRAADIDMTGRLVAAGFIDLHVHGGGGADFMAGTAEAARTAARTHARHGTTGMLATTITAHRAVIDRCIGTPGGRRWPIA